MDATSVGDWCGVHDGRSDENEKERRIEKMPDEMRADWKCRAEPRIERSRAKGGEKHGHRGEERPSPSQPSPIQHYADHQHQKEGWHIERAAPQHGRGNYRF